MTSDENTNTQSDLDAQEPLSNDNHVKIDPSNIPPEYHFLIPDAEKLGISEKELLLRLRPLAERKAQLVAEGWPDNYPNPRVNPTNVPPELHPLIPHAEKWGIPDRKLQEALLREAPLSEIESLDQIIHSFSDDFWKFIDMHLPSEPQGSYELQIFNDFYWGFDEVGAILREKMPARWLEINGWPQAFRDSTIDPAKVTPELQPLVPYANKWAPREEFIREALISIAPTTELEEFITIVNRMGVDQIRSAAVKMGYDVNLQEGYALVLLTDLVGFAERELKKRHSSMQSNKTEGDAANQK